MYRWDFLPVLANADLLLLGLVNTLAVTGTALAFGIPLGLMLALARLSGRRMLAWPAGAWIEFFRTTPPLVQLFWFFFALPLIVGIEMTPFLAACVTFSIQSAAFFAEVFRASIESIHPSQLASADTLGLTRWQAMVHVILPQATRRVAPPLLNDFISLQKDTALLSVIFVFEAMFSAQDYTNYHFNYTPLVVAAVLFICLTIPLTRFTDWVARRMMRREFAGVVK